MENKHYLTNYILAAAFIIFIAIGLFMNRPFDTISSIKEYLFHNELSENDASFNDVEGEFCENIWQKESYLDLNGFIAKSLNMRGLYSNMGMYITDEKEIIHAYDYTSTDYEYEQMVALHDYLNKKGINLIYVNQPIKYLDDEAFENEYGMETYGNRNADLLLSRLREAGINTVDLRDDIVNEGLNINDMFYRTDHHWTTGTGLWAAEKMAEGLNAYCGYDIDTSIYDIGNYNVKEWKSCWLGEQGRKTAVSFVGLDDFAEIKPKFETDLLISNDEGTAYKGTFDSLVHEDYYDSGKSVYECESWHYSYYAEDCINNNVDYGNVLMLRDSYGVVTKPFLALGVHKIDSLVLRDHDDGKFSLVDFIEENDYDTVVVAYAESMIGAHDDTSSANFRMFSFI